MPTTTTTLTATVGDTVTFSRATQTAVRVGVVVNVLNDGTLVVHEMRRARAVHHIAPEALSEVTRVLSVDAAHALALAGNPAARVAFANRVLGKARLSGLVRGRILLNASADHRALFESVYPVGHRDSGEAWTLLLDIASRSAVA